MKKININWKDPKYALPAIIFIPLCIVVYFVINIFSGNSDEEFQPEMEGLNTTLPEAQIEDSGDKTSKMMNMLAQKEFEEEEKGGSGVSTSADEIAERERVARESAALEERIRRSGYGNSYSSSYAPVSNNYNYNEDAEMEELMKKTKARQKAMNKALGIPDPEEEAAKKAEEERKVAEAKRIREENIAKLAPKMMIKSKDVNAERFNTVGDVASSADAQLIKAVIDKTIKATDGTRIQYKLMDDVVVDGVKLKKGTYIYGTVTGFTEQRVKSSITSILVGSKFLKVNLSVYDLDGMEGFYVPASSFREFVKDATSQMASGGNISMGYGETTGEAVALQALQNIYQSASSAISNNAKKNRAKLKYNTIVYLINGNDVK